MLMTLILAAGEPRGDADPLTTAFRQHFDSGAKLPLEWLLAALLVLLLLFVVLGWRRYRQQADLQSAPWRVFHRVASELGLSLSQQWLLRRVALEQSLPTPLTLLFSPHTLRAHGEAYVQGLRPRRRERMAGKLAAISQRVFGAAPVESAAHGAVGNRSEDEAG